MTRSLYLEGEVLRDDLSEEEIRRVIDAKKGTLWVDLAQDELDDRRLLTEVFGFHPLTIEDATNGRVDTPKVDDYETYLFIISQSVTYAGSVDTIESVEVDLFLGPNYVVSVRQEPVPALDEIWDRSHTTTHFMDRGADFLCHTLLDSLVDLILPAVEAMDEEIDELEQQILADPNRSLMPRVLLLKRNTLRLRRAILPQRDIVNRLSRGEFGSLISRDALIFYRDVYDHVVRVEEMLESVRDMADSAVNSYLSAVNNRLNEVMRTLSVVAVIFLPLTLLASIYGTNLDYSLFGANSRYGFEILLLVMFVTAAAMMYVFHRRGWF